MSEAIHRDKVRCSSREQYLYATGSAHTRRLQTPGVSIVPRVASRLHISTRVAGRMH